MDRHIENHYAGNFYGSPNDKEDNWEGLDSACCGATIKMHDICSECLEHCEPEEATNDD